MFHIICYLIRRSGDALLQMNDTAMTDRSLSLNMWIDPENGALDVCTRAFILIRAIRTTISVSV